ncbi:unnamed protein product [Effrenium voratum]|uniref:Uncharacterized protein n=1 Tax=Effrenium voratum TaxID=2562239 RepID=A0AA36JND6_9DINO|nr:unnamed protein product [Effrenium voratum]
MGRRWAGAGEHGGAILSHSEQAPVIRLLGDEKVRRDPKAWEEPGIVLLRTQLAQNPGSMSLVADASTVNGKTSREETAEDPSKDGGSSEELEADALLRDLEGLGVLPPKRLLGRPIVIWTARVKLA